MGYSDHDPSPIIKILPSLAGVTSPGTVKFPCYSLEFPSTTGQNFSSPPPPQLPTESPHLLYQPYVLMQTTKISLPFPEISPSLCPEVSPQLTCRSRSGGSWRVCPSLACRHRLAVTFDSAACRGKLPCRKAEDESC